MKRGFIALLLLILLVSPLILAQEETTGANGEEDAEKEVINFFETKVKTPAIPNFMYLFDIPSYEFDLTWASLILHIVAIAILFVASLEILSYTAMETAWVKALISAAIVAALVTFGAIQFLIELFFNALTNFRLIAWIIVALIIGALLIKPIMNASKKHKRLSKAEQLGKIAGAVLKSQKDTGESSAKEVRKL